MELNPFYQSDDDYEDDRLDISNGNGNVENHDYEDEQLDISNGNVENDENGNKSKSRLQHYNTVKNEEKLKIIKVAKEIGNHKAAKLFNVSRQNVIYWRKQEQKLRAAIGNKKGQKRSVENMAIGFLTSSVFTPKIFCPRDIIPPKL